MARYAQIAKKLQKAINDKGAEKVLINTTQWYSKDKQRPISCYVIKLQTLDKTKTGKQRKTSVEQFRTYSHVQLVLWLRDYWYRLNGWAIPHDNETWEEIKRNYATTGEPSGETDPEDTGRYQVP